MVRVLLLFLGAMLLAACSPVAVLNAFVPEGNLERTSAISYGDSPRQRLDVYVPRGRAAAAATHIPGNNSDLP